jgi:drug/metabolite transporter (DMT)-like permease
MARIFDHFFILSTLLFTVYSQLIMRWQVSAAGPLPPGLLDKVYFVTALLLNPWVMSGVLATFFAGVSWMLVMTKFEISYAFPFVSLNYIIILVAGYFLFGESFGLMKMLGTGLIVLGLLFIAKG